MEDENDIYILIDRYLAGELSAEERKSFEERIKNDSDFAEKVLLYRSVTENLRSNFSGQEEEKRLRETLLAISEEEISGKSARVVSLRWYHWAAAASIALLAVIWFYTDTRTLPQYSQYAFHEPLALAERGDDSLKYRAEVAFNSGNYHQSIDYFNELLEHDPQNRELQLYKGIGLIELGKFQDAELILNDVRNSDSVYKDKATWYLALSALKQKDYTKCKTLLEQLPEDSEDYARAKELLKKL